MPRINKVESVDNKDFGYFGNCCGVLEGLKTFVVFSVSCFHYVNAVSLASGAIFSVITGPFCVLKTIQYPLSSLLFL